MVGADAPPPPSGPLGSDHGEGPSVALVAGISGAFVATCLLWVCVARLYRQWHSRVTPREMSFPHYDDVAPKKWAAARSNKQLDFRDGFPGTSPMSGEVSAEVCMPRWVMSSPRSHHIPTTYTV